MKNRCVLLASAALVVLLGCSSDSSRGLPEGVGRGGAFAVAAGAGGRPGGAVSAGAAGGTSGGAPAAAGSSERVDPVGLVGAAGAGGSASSGSIGAGDGGAAAGPERWVGTWTASPYFDRGNQPPAPLGGAVLRQIARVSLGGSQLRVQFSNLFGNGPVTLQSVHIARCNAAPAVDSTIDTATDSALTFSGAASVTIPEGQELWSDPIDFSVPNLGAISITTAFGNVPSNVVGHSGSRTTSYLQPASGDVSAAAMASAQTTDHWYYISGIDVMADAAAVGVVAIGDSITDGRGTDTNRNNRWTDILAARLLANPATANVAMMNQGIGATNLVGASGTAAQARFDRDVLGQSGVRYAIVFDGVNDIGGGAQFEPMKAAYDDLIRRAHAEGVLIYGATILPFGSNGYYNPANENVRQQVNAYIRSGVFDAYIDFEAAVTDGASPPNLQTEYAVWAQQDGLHPGPAGYQKLGDTPDLALFTR
jgi:lysophospholipase L1-like esterase